MAESSEQASRGFCANCGTQLLWRSKRHADEVDPPPRSTTRTRSGPTSISGPRASFSGWTFTMSCRDIAGRARRIDRHYSLHRRSNSIP